MEDNFTPELIEKARQANSPEELLALAKESGIELSEDKAKEYFEQLNRSGELSDEELDNVSGGGCGGGPKWKCPKYGSKDVEFLYYNLWDKKVFYCRSCKQKFVIYD